MHCKRAKIEIALWAGDDLDAVSIGRLERHLAACPGCREHWKSMKSSLRALHESSDPLVEETPQSGRQSVWPAVAVRLASPEFQGPMGRFNGWVPAIAIASIFLAMVTIASTARSPVTYGDPYGDPHAISVQPVVAPVRSDAGADWQRFPVPGWDERVPSHDDDRDHP